MSLQRSPDRLNGSRSGHLARVCLIDDLGLMCGTRRRRCGPRLGHHLGLSGVFCCGLLDRLDLRLASACRLRWRCLSVRLGGFLDSDQPARVPQRRGESFNSHRQINRRFTAAPPTQQQAACMVRADVQFLRDGVHLRTVKSRHRECLRLHLISKENADRLPRGERHAVTIGENVVLPALTRGPTLRLELLPHLGMQSD